MVEFPPRNENRAWLVLGITGLVCALVIVSTYEFTRSPIERHRAERLRDAIQQVLPGAVKLVSYEHLPSGGLARSEEIRTGTRIVQAGYARDGSLVGFAIRARGAGYQDAIEIMYGYDPRREQIIGLAVLESRETPGLGDRIRSDPGFLSAFDALDTRLAATGDRLLHAVALTDRGRLREAWEVDAITGATVSSAAVIRIINASAGIWIALLHREFGRPGK